MGISCPTQVLLCGVVFEKMSELGSERPREDESQFIVFTSPPLKLSSADGSSKSSRGCRLFNSASAEFRLNTINIDVKYRKNCIMDDNRKFFSSFRRVMPGLRDH